MSEVSRRDWVGALGMMSVAIGARALGGCNQRVPEMVGSSASALSGINVIDFVNDCGADPTGATDCAPALNTAWQLLTSLATDPDLPQQTVVLRIPAGKYSVLSSPNEPNFNGMTTSLEIYGYGDASILQIRPGVGGFAIAFQNVFSAYIHDLAFVGLGDGTSADCNYAIVCAARNWTHIERCRFEYILASTAVVYCASLFTINDCEFGGCGSLSPHAGVLQSTFASCDMRECNFSDIPALNGYSFGRGKASSNTNWYRADDTNSFNPGPIAYYINIEKCLFDESCQRAIHIQGGPTGRLGSVRLRDIFTLPSALAGATSVVHVENVDLLEVDNYRNTGFNTAVAVATLELVSVTAAQVRGLLINPAAACNYMTADSTTGLVTISNSSPELLVRAPMYNYERMSFSGNGLAAGGTQTIDFPIPIDSMIRLSVSVALIGVSGGHLDKTANLPAEFVVKNSNGVCSTPVAAGDATNPTDSPDFATSGARVVTSELSSNLASAVTWSISGTNARLTLTNNDTSEVCSYRIRVLAYEVTSV